jgi:hypothetical protein
MTITLRPLELTVLRRIAAQPRSAHQLTHAPNGVADIQASPVAMQSYLVHLAELGFILEPERRDQPYVLSAEGARFLAELPMVAPSTLIANASMREVYKPKPWLVRDGSEQHKQFRSLGV